MKTFGYAKDQKLKQKKEISLLFEKGKWVACGRMRIIFLDLNKINAEENGVTLISKPKVGASVSKRNFKRAVDRNKIKRLLREAYRLNKEVFEESFGGQTLAMIFWASNVHPEKYPVVEGEFLALCQKNGEKGKK